MSTGEIGGYLELERFGGKPYYDGLIALNAARFALLYSIKARGIKKLYIPYLLCDCVYDVCVKNGCECGFYNVDERLMPVLDDMPGENEYVYIVNFYGQLSDMAVTELKNRYKRVILDNVQDFFRKPLPGIDTVYSCRKYFGVSDGGYLSTDVFLVGDIPEDRSASRFRHLLGRFENSASEFYGEFADREEDFYESVMSYMSPLTKNILSGVDYERVKSRRNENYLRLEGALVPLNRMNFKKPEGPYVYPFLTKNGPAIRKKLAGQNIYIPTLWPDVLEKDGITDFERDFVENLLPLPCDQRYGQSEMDRLIEVLRYV